MFGKDEPHEIYSGRVDCAKQLDEHTYIINYPERTMANKLLGFDREKEAQRLVELLGKKSQGRKPLLAIIRGRCWQRQDAHH